MMGKYLTKEQLAESIGKPSELTSKEQNGLRQGTEQYCQMSKEQRAQLRNQDNSKL